MTGSMPEGELANQRKPAEPGPLDRTHRLFGGLALDVKRRIPYYASDWVDALRPDDIGRVIATVFFLFFAAVVPAITFGNLYDKDTMGSFGVVETILATAVSGVLYSIVAGQPITILGATGPIYAYTIVIYDLADSWGIEFLPFYFWTLMWCSVLTVLLVMFDLCALMRYVTGFSADIFSGLISLIFIVQAITPAVRGFTDGKKDKETAFLEVVLMAVTYKLSTELSNLRQQPWLILPIRAALANFAVLISIVIASALALLWDQVDIDMLDISSTFQPTMVLPDGSARGWFVSPMGENGDFPVQHIFSAILPAIGLAMLGYLDQNLTTVLVNRPSNKLRKPGGYHLDLFVRAVVCTPPCALLGLPLAVASTVPSLTHVMALTTYTIEKMAEGERKVPVKACEQRLTNLLIHVVLGASLALSTVLGFVPRSVLLGVFLYMGIASLNGNQLYDRFLILLMWESKLHPSYEYVLNVPSHRMHLFTFIQLVCLGILYGLNAIKATAVAFPFFMASLMVVRLGFNRIFSEEELKWLDGVPADPAQEEAAQQQAVQQGTEQGADGASPAAEPAAL